MRGAWSPEIRESIPLPDPSTAGHEVRLEPSGHTFSVRPGETILEAALRQNIGLPYGCRNGACGACKGTLRAGSLEFLAYQERALHDSERAAGKARSVQPDDRPVLGVDTEVIFDGGLLGKPADATEAEEML